MLTVSDLAHEVVIKTFNEKENLLWDPICTKYVPWTVSVNVVKGLLKIHDVDIQLPLPLCALFSDVTQCECLLRTSSTFPDLCLFFLKLVVYCIWYSSYNNFGKYFAGDKQNSGAMPVVAVAQGTLLWDLYNDALCSVISIVMILQYFPQILLVSLYSFPWPLFRLHFLPVLQSLSCKPSCLLLPSSSLFGPLLCTTFYISPVVSQTWLPWPFSSGLSCF